MCKFVMEVKWKRRNGQSWKYTKNESWLERIKGGEKMKGQFKGR